MCPVRKCWRTPTREVVLFNWNKEALGGLAAAQSACRKVTEDAFKVGLGRKKDTEDIKVEM